MDFTFTDEQELLVESIKEYAARYFDEESVRQMYANHQITLEAAMAYREAGFMHMGLDCLKKLVVFQPISSR